MGINEVWASGLGRGSVVAKAALRAAISKANQMLEPGGWLDRIYCFSLSLGGASSKQPFRFS